MERRSIDPHELAVRASRLQDALRVSTPADPSCAELTAAALDAAREALRAGRGDLAVPLLERLVVLAPREAAAWQTLGFAYGEDQRLAEATQALSMAATLAPDDKVTAFARAQANLDAGYPAAELFARVRALAPGDLAAVNGWAAALAAQGEPAAAETLLAETLMKHPDWLEGHKNLAALRVTAGDPTHFARSYAAACEVQPRNLELRLAWFSALAQARDWDAALKVVAEGEALIGASTGFAIARACLAGESGDAALAESWFARTASIRDDGLCIAHIRHCLRTRQLEKAETLALEFIDGRAARMIWPYLSVIWRLKGDARAQWLDGAPPYIRAFDLGYSAGDLTELAALLRRLHTARAPHLEQSVRGGTQTDTERQLFFRAEPEVQKVRTRVLAAIREYVAGMPPPASGHPLLGVTRERILFSGSWSVRLGPQGHHVSHTHPKGWISSALYVALPPPGQLGAAPAGWIRFGVPPAALGLDLPAYGQFEPKPGHLVLFPSTMWHETLPFDDGERLVVAFDVIASRTPRPT